MNKPVRILLQVVTVTSLINALCATFAIAQLKEALRPVVNSSNGKEYVSNNQTSSVDKNLFESIKINNFTNTNNQYQNSNSYGTDSRARAEGYWNFYFKTFGTTTPELLPSANDPKNYHKPTNRILLTGTSTTNKPTSEAIPLSVDNLFALVFGLLVSMQASSIEDVFAAASAYLKKSLNLADSQLLKLKDLITRIYTVVKDKAYGWISAETAKAAAYEAALTEWEKSENLRKSRLEQTTKKQAEIDAIVKELSAATSLTDLNNLSKKYSIGQSAFTEPQIEFLFYLKQNPNLYKAPNTNGYSTRSFEDVIRFIAAGGLNYKGNDLTVKFNDAIRAAMSKGDFYLDFIRNLLDSAYVNYDSKTSSNYFLDFLNDGGLYEFITNPAAWNKHVNTINGFQYQYFPGNNSVDNSINRTTNSLKTINIDTTPIINSLSGSAKQSADTYKNSQIKSVVQQYKNHQLNPILENKSLSEAKQKIFDVFTSSSLITNSISKDAIYSLLAEGDGFKKIYPVQYNYRSDCYDMTSAQNQTAFAEGTKFYLKYLDDNNDHPYYQVMYSNLLLLLAGKGHPNLLAQLINWGNLPADKRSYNAYDLGVFYESLNQVTSAWQFHRNISSEQASQLLKEQHERIVQSIAQELTTNLLSIELKNLQTPSTKPDINTIQTSPPQTKIEEPQIAVYYNSAPAGAPIDAQIAQAQKDYNTLNLKAQTLESEIIDLNNQIELKKIDLNKLIAYNNDTNAFLKGPSIPANVQVFYVLKNSTDKTVRGIYADGSEKAYPNTTEFVRDGGKSDFSNVSQLTADEAKKTRKAYEDQFIALGQITDAQIAAEKSKNQKAIDEINEYIISINHAIDQKRKEQQAINTQKTQIANDIAYKEKQKATTSTSSDQKSKAPSQTTTPTIPTFLAVDSATKAFSFLDDVEYDEFLFRNSLATASDEVKNLAKFYDSLNPRKIMDQNVRAVVPEQVRFIGDKPLKIYEYSQYQAKYKLNNNGTGRSFFEITPVILAQTGLMIDPKITTIAKSLITKSLPNPLAVMDQLKFVDTGNYFTELHLSHPFTSISDVRSSSAAEKKKYYDWLTKLAEKTVAAKDLDPLKAMLRAEPYAALSTDAYSLPGTASTVSGYKKITDDSVLKKYGLSKALLHPGPESGKYFGFNADLYEGNGQLVLAFQGSKDDSLFVPIPESLSKTGNSTTIGASLLKDKDWTNNNFRQALLGESPYYELAGYIATQLDKNQGSKSIVFTGHSLGGGMATLASALTGEKAYTFNAAELSNKIVLPKPTSGQIENFTINGDIVGDLASTFGKLSVLTTKYSTTTYITGYNADGTKPNLDALGLGGAGPIPNPISRHAIDVVLSSLHGTIADETWKISKLLLQKGILS